MEVEVGEKKKKPSLLFANVKEEGREREREEEFTLSSSTDSLSIY